MKPGDTIAHFRVEHELGRGAMGMVYRARDQHLRRLVALKILPPEAVGDRERRARLLREAQAAAAINHPNVATVYEIGEVGDEVYISMEYVAGETLRDAIARARLPTERVVEIAMAVAQAVAATHDVGIVHRDLKPANVMVGPGGLVKLVDFGLAKHRAPVDALEATAPEPAAVTQEHVIIGTPAYMSPEQCRGGPADRRSDVFSFGAMLYELITGRRPFVAGTHPELGVAIMHDTPTPLTELSPGVPARLVAIVETCLAKRPDDRYQDFHRVVSELATLASVRDDTMTRTAGEVRPPARRRGLLVGLAAVAAVAAIAVTVVIGSSLTRRGSAGRPPARDAGRSPPELREVELTSFAGRAELTGLALSRDGSQIAFTARRLYVRTVEGGAVHEVATPPDRPAPDVLDFFPDGARLLVSTTEGRGRTLGVLALRDGSVAPWKRDVLLARLAPAGDRLAYVAANGTSIAALAGGDERLLTSDLAFQLAWSPDGRWVAALLWGPSMNMIDVYSADGVRAFRMPSGGLLFGEGLVWSSPETLLYTRWMHGLSASELCAIGVVGGAWDGRPPDCFHRWGGVFVDSLQLTTGRLVYRKTSYVASVATVALDEAGRPRGPLETWPGQEGAIWGSSWTIDGRVLATRTRVGAVDAVALQRGSPPTPLLPDTTGDAFGPLAYGDAVLVHRHRTDREVCELIRVTAGREEVIWSDARVEPWCPHLLCTPGPRPRCVMLRRGDELVIRRFDPVTGREVGAAHHRRDGYGFVGLSADGTKVVRPRELSNPPSVAFLDLDTGSYREVQPRGRLVPHDAAWFGSNGWIVTGTEDGWQVIARMALDGSYRVEQRVAAGLTLHDPLVSPDRRALALTVEQSQGDVFMLDGVSAPRPKGVE